VDWHNALIGHLQHNLRDPHRDRSHGRIWRVRYESNPLLEVKQFSKLSEDELLQELLTTEGRTRYRVRRELAARKSVRVVRSVQEWLLKHIDTASERDLLEMLWLYQTHNNVEPALLRRLLEAEKFEVRAAAVRTLSYWINEIESPMKLLAPRIADTHPRVRLEAVRACSFLPNKAEATELALEVVNQETDAWIDYTLEETLRGLGN
jgi:hypothetical protein